MPSTILIKIRCLLMIFLYNDEIREINKIFLLIEYYIVINLMVKNKN